MASFAYLYVFHEFNVVFEEVIVLHQLNIVILDLWEDRLIILNFRF